MESRSPKLHRSGMESNMPPRWGFSSFRIGGYKDVAPPELKKATSVGDRTAALIRCECGQGEGERGFTLIELMVVIVLIGIMTAMIIPEMRGTFEEALLRSTARELVNAFNLGYSQAVTLNQLHRVRLDSKNGHYFLERKAGEGRSGFIPVKDLPGGEGKLDTRISIQVRKAEETPAAAPNQEAPLVSEEDSRIRNQDEPIVFYPDGTADSGEVRLRDREGFRLALRINPITARVDIVELEREQVP